VDGRGRAVPALHRLALAEHTAESLRRGTHAIATEWLRQHSYESSAAEKRAVIEFDVDKIGPILALRHRHCRPPHRRRVPVGAGYSVASDDGRASALTGRTAHGDQYPRTHQARRAEHLIYPAGGRSRLELAS